MLKKLFCFHDYQIILDQNSMHVWSYEDFQTNKVYRYEYSYCAVICSKCGKYRDNYKIEDKNHPDRHSDRTVYIDIKNT